MATITYFPPASGGGGSGTVTSVASADGTVAITNPTTTPDLSVSSGTVADEATLATLPSATLNAGTRRWVVTFKCGFTLTLGAAAMAAAAHVRIAASGKAGYFWVRDVVTPAWWPQLTWEVNPSTGTSEGDGTLAAPLDTFAELGRRMNLRDLPGTETNSFTVNLRGSSPADTDFVQVHLNPNGRANNVTITISGSAAAVAVPVGTLDSVVAKNAGTNTPFKILKAGFDFSPYVGDVVHLVGTPTTSALVEKAPSLGVAELATGIVSGANDAPFAAGNNVEFYTRLRIPGINIKGQNVTTAIVDLDGGTVAGGATMISEGTVTMQRCRFPRGISASMGAGQGAFWGPSGCSLQGVCNITSGIFSPTAGGVVAGTLTLPLANSRHHLASFGLRASQLKLSDSAMVRFNGDFHAFDTAAGVAAIVMNHMTQIYVSNAVYGQGNDATSALVALPTDSRFSYFSVAQTTWTSAAATPIGAYIDGDAGGATTGGTAVPIAGGLGVGWPIVPGTNTNFIGAIQSAKMNAVMPG